LSISADYEKTNTSLNDEILTDAGINYEVLNCTTNSPENTDQTNKQNRKELEGQYNCQDLTTNSFDFRCNN
jgi:hypothetical protein